MPEAAALLVSQLLDYLTQISDVKCRSRELEVMKQDAILINFARGEVIDKQVRLPVACPELQGKWRPLQSCGCLVDARRGWSNLSNHAG